MTQPGAVLYTQGFGSRPENVEVPIVTNVSPSPVNIGFPVGKRWINSALDLEYVLTSFTTVGGTTTAEWTLLGTDTGALNTLSDTDGTIVTPDANNIQINGTANQIDVVAGDSELTVSLPASMTVPGTLAVTGALTAEGSLGVVGTATIGGDIDLTGNLNANGVLAVAVGASLQLSSAGSLLLNGTNSKITINASDSSNTSIGTTVAMAGNPGSVSIVSSSITVNSFIFYSRWSAGGTLGEVSVTTQINGAITLTSTSANETSTFNYIIFN